MSVGGRRSDGSALVFLSGCEQWARGDEQGLVNGCKTMDKSVDLGRCCCCGGWGDREGRG